MPDLEEKTKIFAREIFKSVGEAQPSVFNKKGLNGRMMQWSMTKPELKFNMFRLVDVLPALQSSRSVAKHTIEYLKRPLKDINLPLKYFMPEKPGKIYSGLMSKTVKYSVRQMASQFIAGESPKAAKKHLMDVRKAGMAFTVDLLGEYSLSEKEAMVYVDRYLSALRDIHNIFSANKLNNPHISGHPGELSANCISVKLTALYSQCGPLNFDRSVRVLSERLAKIVAEAKKCKAQVYVDAEDSANNPIIYKVFKNVFLMPEFLNLHYPGIVLQAYAKNSEAILLDLLNYAKERNSPIAIRLVKGAYWDNETVLSKQQGWESPLFSKKETSDANYEKLSKILIDNHKLCLPAFGSHNIRSLSHAISYAKEKGLSNKDFELQLLYGMADPIAEAFKQRGYLVRFYVPLGEILPGMGYLVRRLLENTSNESFLKHTFFENQNIDNLIKQPIFKE
jgi:RHH-type proline utilization regulon transcriptional repressor/proline dehydrogenase/delta 1-pyrroline-5-carboxylate dehydrogenase